MGKSGGGKKKKKGGVSNSNKVSSSKPIDDNGGNVSDAQILLMKRAQELKEEGNNKYQAGDFSGALKHYSKGLEVIPNDHPNRAVFHSNRAACLMQINPIDYEDVIAECSLALTLQPGFTRALLRRARAFEALGKFELGVQDVNAVLKTEPNHKEAMEMSRQLASPSPAEDSSSEYTEVEMDDWLFDFAQLFRSRLRIDPDAHVDLHNLGVDLCSEALEETLTSKEAQPLFDEAAAKFQQVAASALLDWGNVLMLSAKKRLSLEESTVPGHAYEWVKQRYIMAKEKYEQALSIKPDFHEGLRALGHQQFHMAKLHWSQQKIDLSVCDPTETLKLFDSAEEKIQAATEMREKKEEVSSDKIKKQGDGENEEEASEMLMIWGNILFERSQVEWEIGVDGWEKNLESALERYKLAGASETDISVFVESHCSNQKEMSKKVTES